MGAHDNKGFSSHNLGRNTRWSSSGVTAMWWGRRRTGRSTGRSLELWQKEKGVQCANVDVCELRGGITSSKAAPIAHIVRWNPSSEADESQSWAKKCIWHSFHLSITYSFTPLKLIVSGKTKCTQSTTYLWLNIASSHCQEESPKKSIPNCNPMFERGGDAPANQDGPKTKKLFLLPPIPTLTLTPSIQRFGTLQRVGYRTNYAFKRNFTPIARMSKLFLRVPPNIFRQCDKNSPKYAAVSPLT